MPDATKAPKSDIKWVNLLFDKLEEIGLSYGIPAVRVVKRAGREWKIQTGERGVHVTTGEGRDAISVSFNDKNRAESGSNSDGTQFLIDFGIKAERECLIVEAAIGTPGRVGGGLKHRIFRANLLFNANERAMEAAYSYLQALKPENDKFPKLAWNWWVIPADAKTLEIYYWQGEQVIGFSTDGRGVLTPPTSSKTVDLTDESKFGYLEG